MIHMQGLLQLRYANVFTITVLPACWSASVKNVMIQLAVTMCVTLSSSEYHEAVGGPGVTVMGY